MVGPVWITAETQTAGRGRRGRVWDGGTGNLAATLLFRTDKAPAEAAQISFVAALAVADLAKSLVDPALVRLKWPNDLLIDGKKASGILVETGLGPDGRLWLAVGIGVNLNSAPSDLERPAIALSAYSKGPITPLAALDVLARQFAHWQARWERDGFSVIADAWTLRAAGLGKVCEARLADRSHYGIAEGLDPDGALRLRTPEGSVLRITAGDVFFGVA